MSDEVPGRIVVAGDWHANTAWAQLAIRKAGKLLEGEGRRLIVHLGDFGIWSGAESYISRVSDALDRAGAMLWFIDGNHEDFPLLASLRGDAPGLAQIDARGLLWHVPRGTGWGWHGRHWLAVGGAVSVDRALRAEGRDWWPEEEITEEQAAEVISGGHADVLLSHDCPSGVTHTYPPRPASWAAADLARSDVHQERLQRIVDAVQPSCLIHGHLHMGYQRMTDFGYGPVQVTGLDCDGEKWNYAVLDTRSMTWEPAP